MHSSEILHSMQELFTIVATGESGVSLRGLSRMSGIPQKTLSRWFESDLSHGGVPKELQSLSSQGLYLSGQIKVRGKLIKPVRAEIAAEIIQYAAIDLQKPEAKKALRSFIAIGLDSYIQGATGFLPTANQQATLDPRHEITRLVREPNPWKRLYSAETCGKIRSWYFPRDFFWRFAYGWMTQDEIDFLNEHNPVIEGIWQRRDRIFQMISQDTRDRLAPEIAALCTLVESSTCRTDFETRWRRIHGMDQQELFYA
jgi:hypothetical protein